MAVRSLVNRFKWAPWLLASVLAVMAPPKDAAAVLVEAGALDADGSRSTVDLWFFSFAADTTATLKVNDLGGPPVAGADPDLVVYLDNGSFSDIFATDAASGSDPDLTADFLAGSYIAVVANHPLGPGEFGPFRADAGLAVGGFDYEFSVPAPADTEIRINCVLSGNLGGGFGKRVLAGGGDTCSLPPGVLSEPGGLALLAMGLMAVAWRLRSRPAATARRL